MTWIAESPPSYVREVVERWKDDALRLAFNPATPVEVRTFLMSYVRGIEQQLSEPLGHEGGGGD